MPYFFSPQMGHFMSNFSTFLVAVIIAFVCCWEVGMMAFLVVPMLLVVGATYAKMMVGMSATRIALVSEVTSVVEQVQYNVCTDYFTYQDRLLICWRKLGDEILHRMHGQAIQARQERGNYKRTRFGNVTDCNLLFILIDHLYWSIGSN
uniref:ABC transmembrane type-1 domain-containing protein n=1 Tax=Aegilops tauschii subsp. strangulata TaxID=200361 RepID=A0A453RY43_AEGTS